MFIYGRKCDTCEQCELLLSFEFIEIKVNYSPQWFNFQIFIKNRNKQNPVNLFFFIVHTDILLKANTTLYITFYYV